MNSESALYVYDRRAVCKARYQAGGPATASRGVMS